MSNRSHVTTQADEGSCDAFIVDRAAVDRVAASLPDDATSRAAAAIFDALSDPTRLRILQALLIAGELCVCDLAALAGVSSSAVSHQLRVLRDRDLVTYSRDGKRAVYRLADAHVATLLAQGLDHAAERRGPSAGK